MTVWKFNKNCFLLYSLLHLFCANTMKGTKGFICLKWHKSQNNSFIKGGSCIQCSKMSNTRFCAHVKHKTQHVKHRFDLIICLGWVTSAKLKVNPSWPISALFPLMFICLQQFFVHFFLNTCMLKSTPAGHRRVSQTTKGHMEPYVMTDLQGYITCETINNNLH